MPREGREKGLDGPADVFNVGNHALSSKSQKDLHRRKEVLLSGFVCWISFFDIPCNNFLFGGAGQSFTVSTASSI